MGGLAGRPRHTFSTVPGAVIAKGLDHRETFQVFQPGFDLDKARQQGADESSRNGSAKRSAGGYSRFVPSWRRMAGAALLRMASRKRTA